MDILKMDTALELRKEVKEIERVWREASDLEMWAEANKLYKELKEKRAELGGWVIYQMDK